MLFGRGPAVKQSKAAQAEPKLKTGKGADCSVHAPDASPGATRSTRRFAALDGHTKPLLLSTHVRQLASPPSTRTGGQTAGPVS